MALLKGIFFMDGEGDAFLFLLGIFPKIPTIFPNVGKK